MQINEQKKILRSNFKNIRQTMTSKQQKDLEILNRVKASDLYNTKTDFFVYVSSPIEVDTKELINSLLAMGKNVAVPLCNSEICTMKFYQISSLDELHSGTYGILEPQGREERLAKPQSSSVCFVPALSFNSEGFRLGFGKGYYDRFLSEFEGITVGLCYDECMSEELVHDEFDQKVRYVITETRLYNCGEKAAKEE